MAATIEFSNGVRATVRDGQWTATDEIIERAIRRVTRSFRALPEHPDADIAAAEFVLDYFAEQRGRIVDADYPSYPPPKPGQAF